MSNTAILDTSWLVELYRVPACFDESRTSRVLTETAEFVDTGGVLFVTVPMLFEVASHITRARDGSRRRILAEKFRNDIHNSLNRDYPWTIVTVGTDILLRAPDVLALAEKFLEFTGPNYSFADISVIDLTEELRQNQKWSRSLPLTPNSNRIPIDFLA